MGRNSCQERLTAGVQAYLEAAKHETDTNQLDVKRVAAVLGVSRTSLYKYGLDKVIHEARKEQLESSKQTNGGKPHRLGDMLVQLRQELKEGEARNRALLARLNLVEANAARLGIDPEELYQPLFKPVRAVSQRRRYDGEE